MGAEVAGLEMEGKAVEEWEVEAKVPAGMEVVLMGRVAVVLEVVVLEVAGPEMEAQVVVETVAVDPEEEVTEEGVVAT